MKKEFSEHIKALIEELKDPEYYYAWQANIAMAFKDEISRSGMMPGDQFPDSGFFHEIANDAAKAFLNQLMHEDKETIQDGKQRDTSTLLSRES